MSAEDIPTRLMKLPKLADLVARDLKTSIVRGTLREGDQLPTLERLAARFGVSLAVVREAVRILETEDLLEIRRGSKGGVTVKDAHSRDRGSDRRRVSAISEGHR